MGTESQETDVVQLVLLNQVGNAQVSQLAHFSVEIACSEALKSVMMEVMTTMDVQQDALELLRGFSVIHLSNLHSVQKIVEIQMLNQQNFVTMETQAISMAAILLAR